MLSKKTLATLLLSLLFFPAFAKAQIIVVVSPQPLQVSGTDAVFDVILVSTGAESFDAFTLAFGVGDGGSAVGNPQDSDNLLITSFAPGSIFDNTDFSAAVTDGGVGQSAILVNFNQGSSENIAAGGVLASFSVNSSSVSSGTFSLNPNIVEATGAFDDGAPVEVVAVTGTLTVTSALDPVLLGDVNLDGAVDFLDIAPFIAVLSSAGFQAEADVDQSGEVNFLDIAVFIEILSVQIGK